MAGYYSASYKIHKEDQDAYTVFNIPNSEMGNVVLPDGTKVKLNSSSELRYPMKFLNSREVFLTGEAFFDVTSDPDNPFLVHVDDFTVKVTGTRFNVKSYPDTNPETTLEEGKIAVINSKGNTIVDLKPNENLVYNKAQNRVLISSIDIHQKMGWTEGKIFLKNQTIGEMAKIIERWYNVKIMFDDESLKHVRLTGTILKDKPIEQLLNVLVRSEAIDFKYIEESSEGNIVHIKYKK
jgi:ferric-dicitrate binding protein FerR (iron transport regulator)